MTTIPQTARSPGRIKKKLNARPGKAGLRKGVLYTVQQDWDHWNRPECGLLWSGLPRFRPCGGETGELAHPTKYPNIGPGSYETDWDMNRKTIRDQTALREETIFSSHIGNEFSVMKARAPRFDEKSHAKMGQTMQAGFEHIGPGSYPKANEVHVKGSPCLMGAQTSRNHKVNTGQMCFTCNPNEPRLRQHSPFAIKVGQLGSYYNPSWDAKAWMSNAVPPWDMSDRGLCPAGYRPHTVGEDNFATRIFLTEEKMPLSTRVSNMHITGDPAKGEEEKKAEDIEKRRKASEYLDKPEIPRFSLPCHETWPTCAKEDFAHVGPGTYEGLANFQTIRKRTSPKSKDLFGSMLASKVERFTVAKHIGEAPKYFGPPERRLKEKKTELETAQIMCEVQDRRKKEEQRLCQIYYDSF